MHRDSKILLKESIDRITRKGVNLLQKLTHTLLSSLHPSSDLFISILVFRMSFSLRAVNN